MTLQGGGSHNDLRPLMPDGNLLEGVRGSHRGSASDLNVVGALPGFHYYWGRLSQSFLMRFIRAGWEVVPPDSPERKLIEEPDWKGMELDSIQLKKDVVLLRIPEPKYREIQAHKATLAQIAAQGPTQEYLGKADQLPESARSGADGPLYYRGRLHDPGYGTPGQ